MFYRRSKQEAFGKIYAITDEVAIEVIHAILYCAKEYKKVRRESYKTHFYEWARGQLS